MTGPFSVEERLEILRIELETPEPRHFHHADVAAAVAEVGRLRGELRLAVAHDRQPYPTAHAYEQACAALEKQRRRADRAEAELKGARAAALAEAANVVMSHAQGCADMKARIGLGVAHYLLTNMPSTPTGTDGGR